MRAFPALAASLLVLPLASCFWGSTDAHLFWKVSAQNVSEFRDLLYPKDLEPQWRAIFEERATVCVDGDEEDLCDGGSYERSDLVDLFMPYDSSRVRGLVTQKGDLQITAHLEIGEAWKALAADGFDDWGYLESEDELYAQGGTGCEADLDPEDRMGVGRCLLEMMRQTADDPERQEELKSYQKLDQDLRLVILVNLPSADDIRSTDCQDAPSEFESSDWSYPRTLRVNYNAREPVENEDGDLVYGSDTPFISQCEIEVFARLSLGVERFNADWYGQEDPDGDFHLERVNEAEQTLLGTVELESLALPGEDGEARAKGRYHLRFSAERFVNLDGKLDIEGDFDV